MKRALRVSVRALVEHGLRAGDLDLESFGRGSLLEGTRGHQKVQSSRSDGYLKEVPVSGRFTRGDVELEVHGRIDGVWEGPEPRIEEIKTTRSEPDAALGQKEPTHWGQLEVYAYLYALEHGFDAVGARLTYYQLDTGGMAETERRYTISDLRARVDDLVSRYLSRMERVFAWIERRDASLRAAPFPYGDYRPGQREMAIAIYRAVRDGSGLLLQAPTGIGKTAAALFPALKALAEGKTDRIFFLTARTTGRALAETCLSQMRGSGASVRSVTLTAKDQICFNPQKACNGEECEFARGFYDRLPAALTEIEHHQDFSRSAIESTARRHAVCPYELSLELAPWCDVVVADYNYALDPRARLRLLEENVERAILLVDEAHNLPDRARDMFSASVSRNAFLALGASGDGALGRAARRVARNIEESVLEELVSSLADFLREADGFLRSYGGSREYRRRVLELFFEGSWFVRVAEELDDAYALCRVEKDGDVCRKLFCRDPASRLRERFSSARSSVLFSATLAPLPYFRRTLGFPPSTPTLSIPSPFPGENLCLLVASSVPTTWRRRGSSETELTRLLSEFVSFREGNYLFYFPSYEYLEAIRRRFENENPGMEVAVQTPEMGEAERASFLSRFDAVGKTLAGFAVMGGVFGEAIDLPGEKLEGAAIVGVGLPAPSPERERIRERFDLEGQSGFDYAYVYPGINRVLQAAGRVIRSETDRGAVLLVDERFLERRYRSLLPSSWRPRVVTSSRELVRELREFWS